jgi:hypothetical protein
MILVFGILGLIVCFPFGIVAWVMGNTDLKAMDAGTMDPEGRGTTQAGKIIGMIATIVTVLSLIIGILFFAVALILPAVASSSSLLI